MLTLLSSQCWNFSSNVTNRVRNEFRILVVAFYCYTFEKEGVDRTQMEVPERGSYAIVPVIKDMFYPKPKVCPLLVIAYIRTWLLRLDSTFVKVMLCIGTKRKRNVHYATCFCSMTACCLRRSKWTWLATNTTWNISSHSTLHANWNTAKSQVCSRENYTGCVLILSGV